MLRQSLGYKEFIREKFSRKTAEGMYRNVSLKNSTQPDGEFWVGREFLKILLWTEIATPSHSCHAPHSSPRPTPKPRPQTLATPSHFLFPGSEVKAGSREGLGWNSGAETLEGNHSRSICCCALSSWMAICFLMGDASGPCPHVLDWTSSTALWAGCYSSCRFGNQEIMA